MSRDIKLILKVDSKSGIASIKKISTEIKKLGADTTAGGTAMKGSMLAAAGSMVTMSAAVGNVSKSVALSTTAISTSTAATAASTAATYANAKARYNAATVTVKETAARIRELRDQNELFGIKKKRMIQLKKEVKIRQAVYKEVKEARKEKDKYAKSTKESTRHTKKHTDSLTKQKGVIKSLKQTLFGLRSYWLAITAAVAVATVTVAKFFSSGFMAVENYKLSIASLAATITSFEAGVGDNLEKTYAQSYKYSEALVLKMEEWNAKTVATGKNLSAMVETMAQGGVLLDINNKKQEKGFLAIANALALITQGQNQDIQFRQEIRGLLLGEVRATNLLSRIISQRIGGGLKKQIELWKEQGTLVENVGALLVGFSAATKDLESTWVAVGTTLETMYNRVLRGMFVPVYEDIISMGQQITAGIIIQSDETKKFVMGLRTGLYKTWVSIKNVVITVRGILAVFGGPLKLIWEVTKMIFDGWGKIFAVLAPIMKRVRLLSDAMWSGTKAVVKLAESLAKFAVFDFVGARKASIEAVKLWGDAGAEAALVYAEGFKGVGDDIVKSLADYHKDLTIPAIGKVTTPTGASERRKAATAEAAALKTEVTKLAKEIMTVEQTLLENVSDVGTKWYTNREDYHKELLALARTYGDKVIVETERINAEAADPFKDFSNNIEVAKKQTIDNMSDIVHHAKTLETEYSKDMEIMFTDHLEQREAAWFKDMENVYESAGANVMKPYIEAVKKIEENPIKISVDTEAAYTSYQLLGEEVVTRKKAAEHPIEPIVNTETAMTQLKRLSDRAKNFLETAERPVKLSLFSDDVIKEYIALGDKAREFTKMAEYPNELCIFGDNVIDAYENFEKMAGNFKRMAEEPNNIELNIDNPILQYEALHEHVDTFKKATEDAPTVNVIDKASPVLREIQGDLNSLRDKTITITTVHKRIDSPSEGSISVSTSSETPSYQTGTGLSGLPYTGLFHGHKGEIVKSPSESVAERKGNTGNTYNITVSPQFMSGDRVAARSVATEIQRELNALSIRRG